MNSVMQTVSIDTDNFLRTQNTKNTVFLSKVVRKQSHEVC